MGLKTKVTFTVSEKGEADWTDTMRSSSNAKDIMAAHISNRKLSLRRKYRSKLEAPYMIDIDKLETEIREFSSRKLAEIDKIHNLLEAEIEAEVDEHDIKGVIVNSIETSTLDEDFEREFGIPMKGNVFVKHGNGITIDFLRKCLYDTGIAQWRETGYITNQNRYKSKGTLEVKMEEFSIGEKTMYIIEGYYAGLNKPWKIEAILADSFNVKRGNPNDSIALIRISGNAFRVMINEYTFKPEEVEALKEEHILSDNVDKKALVQEFNLQQINSKLLK